MDIGNIAYRVAIKAILFFIVVSSIGAVISAGFAQRLYSALLLETLNGLLLILFLFGTVKDVSFIVQYTLVTPPLGVVLMLVLFLQRHYFKGKPCKCIHLVLLSLFVLLYSLIAVASYTVFSLDLARVWTLLLQAIIYIIAWLVMILLVRFHREKLLPQLRGKGYLSCALMASVTIIIFGILCLHYTSQITRKEVAGCMTLTVFLNVLTPISLFKHPKHLPELLHIMIHMFGAVGLTVINSITLAAALILKAEKGGHSIKDLLLIVLPAEAAFVSCWLALQCYDAWIRNKARIKRNFEKEAEPEELEPLPANTLPTNPPYPKPEADPLHMKDH